MGDECFEYVKEVKLIGLNQLEIVMIGKKSFTQCKDYCPNNCYSHCAFYVKNCERLRELKIGCYSFTDYSMCEIENLPSLRVIEMGGLSKGGNYSFCNASLVVKSDCQRMM